MAAPLRSGVFDGRRPSLQPLLLLETGNVRFVPSVLHLVDRNEMKGGGINDVSLARGRFRVGKDMAKPGIASLGAHLGSLHFVCVVGTSTSGSFEMGFVNVGRPTWPSNLSTEANSGSRVTISTVDADLLDCSRTHFEKVFVSRSPEHGIFLSL